MLVGTAGHVDHGKTSLVKALTGVDTSLAQPPNVVAPRGFDRLPEEKKRGITLELGFANWKLPSGRAVGVVDVPGHERFIKAMAAGAGGVDVAMLVVAADEGVMPQTREHLDICTLLGVRAGVLVVTKSDLLPELGDGWLELLEADVRKLTVGTPFEGAPLCAVSAKSGAGLAELARAVDDACARLEKSPPAGRGVDAPVLLPIDRAFTVKGFGLVVTGTLWSGRVAVGDELSLLPDEKPCRVRGVQVHGKAVEFAVAGTRVALNLPDLSLEDVSRGHALVRRGELGPVTSADVALTVLPAETLGKRTRLRATVGTAHVEAVVHLLPSIHRHPDPLPRGRGDFARLGFAAPIAALPGQRFILRSTRAGSATVAGGTILVLNPPRRRREAGAKLEAFQAAPLEERLRLLLVDAGYAGLRERELVARSQASTKEVTRALEKQSSKGAVVLIEKESRRFVAGDVLTALTSRLLIRLDALHTADPSRAGVPREELRQRLGEPSERVFARGLEPLLAAKKVELTGELVRLPGRGSAFTQAVGARQKQLRETLEARALQPPTLYELASTLKAPEADVIATGQALVAAGHAIRAGELFFARSAVDALQARLLDWFTAHERLSTQDFKELTGLSRKFLIPLAEYFDRQKVTLRVGDERTLRKPQTC